MYISTRRTIKAKTITPGSHPKTSAICTLCGRQFIPVSHIHPLCAYCKIDKEIKAKYERK